MSSNKPNPLPLGKVLRDLAILRASNVNLSDGTTFPDAESADSANSVDGTQQSVQQSYQFVKETREALRVHQRGDLDKQGDELDILRSKLEEVRDGAQNGNNKRWAVQTLVPFTLRVADVLRNSPVVVLTSDDKKSEM